MVAIALLNAIHTFKKGTKNKEEKQYLICRIAGMSTKLPLFSLPIEKLEQLTGASAEK